MPAKLISYSNPFHSNCDANNNTAFIDDKFNIVATKTIKSSEELYLTYGYGYWTDRLQRQTESPFTIIFIDVAFGDLKFGNHKYGEKLGYTVYIVYLPSRFTSNKLYDQLS